MSLDDGADRRQLVAAEVEALAGLGVVDVHLPGLRHRADDEHVVARRMPFGLKISVARLGVSKRRLQNA